MSCSRCQDWTTSIDALLEVLRNAPSACAGCAQAATIKVVVEQYQTRRPRWWMVGSTVVVPIWLVEAIRMRKSV